MSLGLDFGTTNSVVAGTRGAHAASALTFEHDEGIISTFRSVLCFWQESAGQGHPIGIEAGPWAIDHFIENPGDCRFIQSLKSFAASPLFAETRIYGRRFTFEELLQSFLLLLRAHAGSQMESLPRRLVVGRPVRFAGGNPDPDLALSRYRTAFERFGVEDLRFVYEPVAAAFYFAQRLRGDATVLVADFGGGTSDFSIMRFESDSTAMQNRALAWSGVGVAGDNFDFHIIDRLISPELGKGSRYRSMTKDLVLPNRFFTTFARWSELSLLKTSRDFRDFKRLQKTSLVPEQLQTFIDLVENDLGYALYKTVSEAKARLSSQEETTLEFASDGIDLGFTLKRGEFESWIADDLRKMDEAVDEAMRNAGLKPDAIDRVFLTGGTSFVPAVRRMFEARFGADKIESGDELISIAHGLALIGEREDIDLWCTGDGE